MSGSVQLSSANYLSATSGRPEFQVRMKRGFGPKYFQVFGMEKGILMLNMGRAGVRSQIACVGAGGFIGGGVGGMLGAMLERASEATDFGAESPFASHSDNELVGLAREKKGSLVLNYDEISHMSFEATGMLDAFCRGSSVVGVIHLKEDTFGKMTWELCDVSSMQAAYEFLTVKLKNVVKLNAVLSGDRTELVKR